MLISMFGATKAKVVLGVSGTVLILSDLIVIADHQLTSVVTTIRGFSSVNGLLIGLAVPLAISLSAEKTKRSEINRPGNR